MSALMVGPSDQATPHQHSAQDGSWRVAASKARALSAALKENDITMPWSNQRWACRERVPAGRE